MRKINKFLGVIAIATLCVLGLASCNNKVTVEVTVQTSTSIDQTEKVSGDLYVHTNNYKEPDTAGSQYILLGSDGILYVSEYLKVQDKYIFTKLRSWSIISDKIICLGDDYYLRDDKYIVTTSTYNGFVSAYMRVDGLKYANK